MEEAKRRIGELLAEAKARVELLSENLPTVVDPAGISLKAKIPYKALCYREALTWRIEELSRSACRAYEEGDYLAGIVLSRSATEVASAIWYLKELIERQVNDGIEVDLDENVMKLLLGSRNNKDMPAAKSVLTFVNKVSKTIPAFEKAYDSLSEYAHPNWSGTSLIYSKHDPEKVLTNFGKDLRGSHSYKIFGLQCLIGSLTLFEGLYNQISDLMPDFAKACEDDLNRSA
jgi:hypothetical protein